MSKLDQKLKKAAEDLWEKRHATREDFIERHKREGTSYIGYRGAIVRWGDVSPHTALQHLEKRERGEFTLFLDFPWGDITVREMPNENFLAAIPKSASECKFKLKDDHFTVRLIFE